MKRTLIVVFLIAVSCQKQKSDGDIKSLGPKEDSYRVSDPDKLENDVFQTIESIENSTPENRRTSILKFIAFADEVDGSVAEGYSNFAFEYVENSPENFFPVLNENDSLLLSKWAAISSSEVILIAENAKEIDSILKNIKENHILKRAKLNASEIKLDELYLVKLGEEIGKY